MLKLGTWQRSLGSASNETRKPHYVEAVIEQFSRHDRYNFADALVEAMRDPQWTKDRQHFNINHDTDEWLTVNLLTHSRLCINGYRWSLSNEENDGIVFQSVR
jgi:hypothetical protein